MSEPAPEAERKSTWISLNVGGVLMGSYLSTFVGVPAIHSHLGGPLSISKDKDGNYLLDRDPIYFAAFLRGLRGYKLNSVELKHANDEAHFWEPELISFGEEQTELAIRCPDYNLTQIASLSAELLIHLPKLKQMIDGSMYRHEGLQLITLNRHRLKALNEFAAALHCVLPIHPMHWHVLRELGMTIKYGLDMSELPYFPRTMDPYANSYILVIKHGTLTTWDVTYDDELVAQYRGPSLSLSVLIKDFFSGCLVANHAKDHVEIGCTVVVHWPTSLMMKHD
jgi:hypothetical protein